MAERPSRSLADLRDDLLSSGAECVHDRELHDGPDGPEEPVERAAREAVAREICASCPARPVCLSYVLRVRPAEGVWAGYTADELAGLADLWESRDVDPERVVMIRDEVQEYLTGGTASPQPITYQAAPAPSRHASTGAAPITSRAVTAPRRLCGCHPDGRGER
ncbi:MAG: hypothetical protein GEV03_22155 [Streptosporangiales bacterium]|nr:hypothetical protein [Streptosporangiales bacterium]